MNDLIAILRRGKKQKRFYILKNVPVGTLLSDVVNIVFHHGQIDGMWKSRGELNRLIDQKGVRIDLFHK